MEKVGCCLQEALDKETTVAYKVEQLEYHMQTKRYCRTCLLLYQGSTFSEFLGKDREKLCNLIGWWLVTITFFV